MSRRYIDADKLLNPDNIIVMQDETGIDEFPYTYTNAVKVETILSAPTADVVEVVRCKDCRYCEEAHYEEEGEKPYIKLKCKWSNYSHQPNDFCSYGERREG